jgi:hypothetical protein
MPHSYVNTSPQCGLFLSIEFILLQRKTSEVALFFLAVLLLRAQLFQVLLRLRMPLQKHKKREEKEPGMRKISQERKNPSMKTRNDR